MRLIVYVLFFLMSIPLYGQEKNNNMQDVDFSSLTLRPNSRDYMPTYMNNHHQRLEHRKAMAISNQIRQDILKNPDFLRRHQLMQNKSREVMRKHMQQRKQFRQRQMIKRQIIRQRRMQENRPGSR